MVTNGDAKRVRVLREKEWMMDGQQTLPTAGRPSEVRWYGSRTNDTEIVSANETREILGSEIIYLSHSFR